MTYKDYMTMFADVRNDLAYIADIDTREMLFVSKGAMKLLGLNSEEDYLGKKCYEIMQNRPTPCEFCTSGYLLEGKSPYRWERYNPVAKRSLRYEDYYFEIDGRRCLGELAIDLSRDIEAVNALQKQFDLEKVIHRGMSVLSTEENADTALVKFLECVGEYYQAQRTVIFEINKVRNIVSNTYEWCALGYESRKHLLTNTPIGPVISDIIDTFESGQTVKILTAHNTNAEFSEAFGTDCEVLLTPLRRNGALVGFFGIDGASIHEKNAYILNLFENLIVEGLNKRNLMKAMQSLEYTDKLTGLPNRTRFFEVLNEYQVNKPASLAVYAINMNGLKEINESYGHDVGDRTIQNCADILGKFDMDVYRTNGDEFVMLLLGVDMKSALVTEAQLRSELKSLHPSSASLGLAWSDDIKDIFQLVNEADEKMYADKQVYYRDSAFSSGSFHMGNAAMILNDIMDGRFAVYYQPQYSLKTGEIYGAEALVRKFDRDGNIVPPGEFIHMYEVEGVISHLDFHVLELVCKSLSEWKKTFGKQPHISVNFSRQTLLEPEVVDKAHAICKKYDVPADRIMIEITESTGKLSQDQLENLLAEFREVGFSVSLDDFGSKYSNLSIFTAIDFDLIKLDKSLIDQVCDEGRGHKVVSSLLNLCHDAISTATLAEGVETKDQAVILRDSSCDYVQGFFFSRPMPEAQFTELLQSNSRFPVEDLPRTEVDMLFSRAELITNMAKNSSNMLGYNISDRHAVLSQTFADTYHLPSYIPDLPNWMVENNRVSPRYTERWYEIFEKLERGETVEQIIQMRNRFGGNSRFRVTAEVLADEDGSGDFAMVFLNNITSEQEAMRRRTQDVEALLQVTKNIFPEILTLNLTRNTYRMVQYHEDTARGTPKEGIISDMIDIRLAAVVDEDKDTFLGTASLENIKKAFIDENKNSVSVSYRRPGRDGKTYWFETTVMRQQQSSDNPDDDVLLIAFSRPIDEQKSEETRLRDELYLKEQEIRMEKQKSSRFFCYYDVKPHTLSLPSEYAKRHNISEVVQNYPDYLADKERDIDPGVIKALMGFYGSICSGDRKGSVEFKSFVKDDKEHWLHMEFETIFDVSNNPARAVITVDRFTKEIEE